jgi:hypothetical protein
MEAFWKSFAAYEVDRNGRDNSAAPCAKQDLSRRSMVKAKLASRINLRSKMGAKYVGTHNNLLVD